MAGSSTLVRQAGVLSIRFHRFRDGNGLVALRCPAGAPGVVEPPAPGLKRTGPAGELGA
jgi:hypothetical protein